MYVHLTAAALATTNLRLGPGVTNPLTRHPSATGSAILALDEVSDGRADLFVGPGYSSAYLIGSKAATLASMREAAMLWRSAFRGDFTRLPGMDMRLEPSAPHLPIYFAASGPKALALAGEVADGVLIMVGASPGTGGWALERVEEGMARANRRREDVKRFIVVTACVDDDVARAVDRRRPQAAMLYRHRDSKTLLERAGLDVLGDLPTLPPVYPDVGHAVDWEAAKAATRFVPDEAVRATMAVGSARAVAERARELIALDIDGLWWRDEASYSHPHALLQSLSEDVLPYI